MEQTQSLAACAELVQRGDPDRFAAVMAAPPETRGDLFTLYAFNLEIARAPWVTKEPLIARMRLQFWRDVVEGEETRAHEVAAPRARLIRARGLSPADLMAMIDAREVEVGTAAPFESADALWDFLRGSAGALMALAVQSLGGPQGHAGARDIGTAQGMANYLMALPALEAAGRRPVPDGRPEALGALAAQGLALFDKAARHDLPHAARPALLAAWRSRSILKQAARDPSLIASGSVGQCEFARRGGRVWASFAGV